MSRLSRREVLRTGLVAVGAAVHGWTPAAVPAAAEVPSFHFDHVLGTSLDVWAVGGDLAAVERVLLDKIERLRRVFSTFDPDSELSRLNRASGPVPASDDLLAVLREYESWQPRTGGALGAVLEGGMAPEAGIGWVIDTDRRTVRRTTPFALNLNAVAKGYITRRAAEAVRASCPGMTALLVNLGGDLALFGDEARGRSGWRVGIQDPQQPAENAPLLGTLRLRDQAVATSGLYQRGSHLIDPRTGRPARDVLAATVVAPTSTTANLLATTLCVLPPKEGLRLLASVPDAECLILGADGQEWRSAGFAELEEPCAAEPAPKGAATAWPEDRQVTIALELPRPTTGRGARRPYVAVWIEDAAGKAVRTVAVWGNSPKWINTLTNWWKIGRGNAQLVRAVTRATRMPGKYELVWDGRDDKGNFLPQGTYTVRVEVHREHGRHVVQTGKIACAAEDAKVTLEKNAETGDTLVQYAKKK